jgi:hypothetical protein
MHEFIDSDTLSQYGELSRFADAFSYHIRISQEKHVPARGSGCGIVLQRSFRPFLPMQRFPALLVHSDHSVSHRIN